MKSGPEREAIITRLQPSGQWWRWYNDGYAADAIIVHLNKMATLSSIGLYGTKTVREISVQIDIFNDQCQNIFTKDTAFLCTGSADPIQVPVYVPMLAGKDYTVCAVINSGQEQTYYGDKGSRTVKVDDSLVVTIKDSDISSNGTSSSRGQFPTLGFVII